MISVLVVEDDPVAAEAHRLYVERIAGFTVAGVVHAGGEAVRFCLGAAGNRGLRGHGDRGDSADEVPLSRRQGVMQQDWTVAGNQSPGDSIADPSSQASTERRRVDLILLDFYLPDTHGLAVCQALRAAGVAADVIAVTSARDLAMVRAAVSAGVVQYLLKPFTFASLREKLERYARFRDQVSGPGEVTGQADVDGMFAELRTADHRTLPKGMSGETLDAVTAALHAAAEDGLSAAAAAETVGASRVTARRYLEYLADNGLAQRRPHYGQVGRPEVRYVPVT